MKFPKVKYNNKHLLLMAIISIAVMYLMWEFWFIVKWSLLIVFLVGIYAIVKKLAK